MVTRGGQYWQVVFGMAVAMILIPSTKPQGEWVWSQQVSGCGHSSWVGVVTAGELVMWPHHQCMWVARCYLVLKC